MVTHDTQSARTTHRAAAWPALANVSMSDLVRADTTETLWRKSHHLSFKVSASRCTARCLVAAGARQVEFPDHAAFHAALRDAVDGATEGGGLVRDEVCALAAKIRGVLPPRVGAPDGTKLARHLLSNGLIGSQALHENTTKALFKAKRIDAADMEIEHGLAKELGLQEGDYVCGELATAIRSRGPRFPWSSPQDAQLVLPVGIQLVLPVHVCIDEGLARVLISYVFDIEA